MNQYTASWIIRFIVMSVSLICSLLTSVVIIFEHVSKQTFPQLILLIELSFAVINISNLCYFTYRQDEVACKAIGLLVYGLWISTFTLTLLLLFIIERRFSGSFAWISRINKRWPIIIAFCFIIPFTLAAIPIQQYRQCGYGTMDYYCSLCSRGAGFWADEFTVTIIILILSIILFSKIRYDSQHIQVLGDEQRLSILVMKIPIANFVILFLNLLTKTINIQGIFWLFTVVNLLFYFVPIINLYLFVRFMKQYPATIYYFNWLIKKKKEKVLLASRYVQM